MEQTIPKDIVKCHRCGFHVVWNKTIIDEKVDDSDITTIVERGFCPSCGLIYFPQKPNYSLLGIDITTEKSFVLANGDTFNSVYSLLPVFKGIFECFGREMKLQIIGKDANYKDNKDKVLTVLYEESLNPNLEGVNFIN